MGIGGGFFRTGILAEIDATEAKAGAADFNRAQKSMGDNAERQSRRIESDSRRVGVALKAIATGVAAVAAARLVRGIVSTASAFEQLAVQLETVEGSAEKAKSGLAFVTDFTARTPFQLENVTAAYIRLRNFGIDPTTGALQDFGDLAGAFGEDITQSVEAVTAAVSGENEQLKRFGIVARSETDSVSLTFRGHTIEVERNAEAIAKALRGIAQENFSGAMGRQLNTLDGAFSNLQDNLSLLANSIGKGGLNTEIRRIAESVRDFAGSAEAAEFAKNLATGLAATAKALATITSAGVDNFERIVDLVILLGAAQAGKGLANLLALGGPRGAIAGLGIGLGFLAGEEIKAQAAEVVDGVAELEAALKTLSDKSVARLFKDFIGTDAEGNSLGAANVAEFRVKVTADPIFRKQIIDAMADARKELGGNDGLAIQAHLELAPNAVDSLREQVADELAGGLSAPLAPDQGLARGRFNDRNGLPIEGDFGVDSATLDRIKADAGEVETFFSVNIPTAAELMRDTTLDAFNAVGDGIAEMVKGGKLDFESLATDIIAQMVRIYIQAQLLGLASTLFGRSGTTSGPTTSLDTLGPGGNRPANNVSDSNTAAWRQPNNVTISVQTQPGETARVREELTSDGVYFTIITENIEGSIAGRAARGGGPFAPAVSSPARFQR